MTKLVFARALTIYAALLVAIATVSTAGMLAITWALERVENDPVSGHAARVLFAVVVACYVLRALHNERAAPPPVPDTQLQ